MRDYELHMPSSSSCIRLILGSHFRFSRGRGAPRPVRPKTQAHIRQGGGDRSRERIGHGVDVFMKTTTPRPAQSKWAQKKSRVENLLEQQ